MRPFQLKPKRKCYVNLLTGIYTQKAYTHLGTSSSQCIHQICSCIYSFCQIHFLPAHAFMHFAWELQLALNAYTFGVHIECLIAIFSQNAYIHGQVTKEFAWGKYLNECTRFGYVSLCSGRKQFLGGIYCNNITCGGNVPGPNGGTFLICSKSSSNFKY